MGVVCPQSALVVGVGAQKSSEGLVVVRQQTVTIGERGKKVFVETEAVGKDIIVVVEDLMIMRSRRNGCK